MRNSNSKKKSIQISHKESVQRKDSMAEKEAPTRKESFISNKHSPSLATIKNKKISTTFERKSNVMLEKRKSIDNRKSGLSSGANSQKQSITIESEPIIKKKSILRDANTPDNFETENSIGTRRHGRKGSIKVNMLSILTKAICKDYSVEIFQKRPE